MALSQERKVLSGRQATGKGIKQGWLVGNVEANPRRRKLDELASAVPAGEDPAELAALDGADARARITRDVVARQGP